MHRRPARPVARAASRIRGAALAASTTALLILASGCASPDVVMPTAPAAPLRVVSLGDSYSTGTGPAEPLPGDPGVCGRTVASSVRVAAAEVGAELVDAACDGASTADLIAPRERGGQTVPAQLDALADGADVVLVRLGGNDLGFPALVGGCLARDPDGPVAAGPATCVDALAPAGGTDGVRARIDGEVATRLGEAFARIRAAAPDARIVALGYLTVLGDPDALPAEGCLRATATSTANGQVLLTDRDAAWLAGIQRELDGAIARAAADAGARFVDQETPTAAHGSCAGDAGDPYVAGLGGSQGSVPLHPNATGLAWEAGALAGVLREEAAALGR
ncbi:SGNH/GDSL hydrolase family protein [Clavibacter phaseoli]|uniref:SGNH/GDSL hydrolase family protein n=2 Tax=Clavibacter phaseoli TaxID=1734031 RepID=UPI001F3FFB3C|nr:SGNH/GDSL hydrolase family protein [Clavibacter phaseoli]UKF30693.1 SGNH/GDSL hydrolase family protein [Clavibacter phaseoli]UKF36611.1 SGNH/GDSL hydrolase family protein [Clavibacter phaseoli]